MAEEKQTYEPEDFDLVGQKVFISEGSSIQFRFPPEPISGKFVPKPDITAYELALVLPYVVVPMVMYQEDLDRLERLAPGISRHLEKKT